VKVGGVGELMPITYGLGVCSAEKSDGLECNVWTFAVYDHCTRWSMFTRWRSRWLHQTSL